MRIFAPSQQVSAKNMPGHTTLKFRCAAAACWGLCTATQFLYV